MGREVPLTDDDLEAQAQRLEASGQYRVLRRIKPNFVELEAPTRSLQRGLYVDVETTGLDPIKDEIIELAMVPFTYSLDGEILAVGHPYQGLREPSQPIPEEITQLTGIDDAMVAGRSIDANEVANFVAPCALVVAHNAAFDRRFLERLCETFTTKAWACSMSQVDWAREDIQGLRLSHIATALGLFYDAHRAADDCLAGVEVLRRPLASGAGSGFAQLLNAARQATWRIWAENSPFDLKDVLKARGYRWNGDPGPQPRAWYIDVPEVQREAELRFLRTEIYRYEVDPPVRRIDAYDRFSDRI